MVDVEGVQDADGVLLDGSGATVWTGAEESSEVLITATISTTTRTTAVAPAANIVAGRLNQRSGS